MRLERAIPWSGYNDDAILDHLLGNVKRLIFENLKLRPQLPQSITEFWNAVYDISGNQAYGDENQFETQDDRKNHYYS